MASEELIEDRVSISQVKKAVDALHAYESKKQQEKEETELLPGKEPNIWLNVTVKQVAPKSKVKPVKIPIVHPLVDPRTTSVCLISKDPQREFKDLLESHNIKFISRVVGISKLKGKFKAFEARRLLLKENGLFLADDRVIPLLPKLLGSKWFEAKKQPIPVSMTRKDLKAELERAISSTYMHQNNGTCTSIKIGTLSQKPSQVVSNIQKALPAIAAHIPGDWDNIQSFFIKTNTSVSLPIWSCDLSERWSVSKDKGEKEEEGVEEKGEKGKGKKREQNGAVKGKKGKGPVPAVEEEEESDESESDGGEGESEEEEEEEHPRKKIKSGKTTSAPSTFTTKPSTKSTKTQPVTDKSQKPKKSTKPAAPPPSASTSTAQKPSKQKTSSSTTSKKTQTTSHAAPTETAKPRTKEPQTPSTALNPGKAASSKASLTKAELKQKRAALGGGSLGGKKQKVVAGKSVNGKSAKAKMLGKKALQA